MSERLDLSEDHRRIVEALLEAHAPGLEVWAYGSRTKGRGHAGSDLDLVLRPSKSSLLPGAVIRAVQEAFRESSLPFLVDVHAWSALPDGFRSQIERNHVVLIEGAEQLPSHRHASP